MSEPQIGERAPDFTLKSTSGEMVRLSQFQGKKNVLVSFFPLAFTPVCTAQNCAFSEEYTRFESKDTVVLPVSVDSTATLAEFRSKHGMGHHLVSDFKREASRAFGVLDEEKYYSRRSYFLVDKQGILRWKHVEPQNSQSRANPELLQQIEALSR